MTVPSVRSSVEVVFESSSLLARFVTAFGALPRSVWLESLDRVVVVVVACARVFLRVYLVKFKSERVPWRFVIFLLKQVCHISPFAGVLTLFCPWREFLVSCFKQLRVACCFLLRSAFSVEFQCAKTSTKCSEKGSDVGANKNGHRAVVCVCTRCTCAVQWLCVCFMCCSSCDEAR